MNIKSRFFLQKGLFFVIEIKELSSVVKTCFRDSIVVSISACHADDPGSIPGRGVLVMQMVLVGR